MHRLLVTTELLFGWPHPKGISCNCEDERPYGECLTTIPWLHTWTPELGLWWHKLNCKSFLVRFSGINLFMALLEGECEVVFRQTPEQQGLIRTFYRGPNGEREMASLESPELRSIAEGVIRRSSRTSLGSDSTVGELRTFKPDAKWNFSWDSVRQELRMSLIPGSFHGPPSSSGTCSPPTNSTFPA